MLVFALLSMIADEKQNVIFAMEEPEIAIPPHTQKRVIESVRASSSQVLFTSHSPYVLEEFEPSQIAVLRREGGTLTLTQAALPPTVKMKAYRREMRTRFSEALLARRVLIVEGRTEYDVIPAASRRMAELDPESHRSLDSLGIAVVPADTDSQVVPLVEYFEALGKTVFAIYDTQTDRDITGSIEYGFEAPEKGMEKVLANHTKLSALQSFIEDLIERGEWPLSDSEQPEDDTSEDDYRRICFKVLRKFKGSGESAELVSQCQIEDMPTFIVETLEAIQELTEPVKEGPDEDAVEDAEEDEWNVDGEDE